MIDSLRALCQLGLLCTVLLCCATRPCPAAEVYVSAHTLQGETVTGKLGRCTSETLEVLNEPPRTFPIQELIALDFPRPEWQFASGDYVLLNNGDRLAILQPRVVDDELVATWSRATLRPQLHIPLEFLRGMALDLPPARRVVQDRLAPLMRPVRGHDLVHFITGDELTGELQQLDAGLLEIETSLGLNKLDRRRVKSFQLDADLSEHLESPAVSAVVWLTDGSRCTLTQWQPKDAISVQLTLLAGGAISVGWHEIARLEIHATSTQPCSAREPLRHVYLSYLPGTTEPRFGRNHTLDNHPLSIRGQEFSTGFCAPPRTELTFPLQPEDVAFQTWIGIDDTAEGQGRATFEIVLDEEIVWSRADVTGRDPAWKSPRISLEGHQTLTLRTDFGPQGDVGDLAVWGSPTMIVRQP